MAPAKGRWGCEFQTTYHLIISGPSDCYPCSTAKDYPGASLSRLSRRLISAVALGCRYHLSRHWKHRCKFGVAKGRPKGHGGGEPKSEITNERSIAVRHTPPPTVPVRTKMPAPTMQPTSEERKRPCRNSLRKGVSDCSSAEFIDRLCSEDIQHFWPKMAIWFSMRRRIYLLWHLNFASLGSTPSLSVFGRRA